MSDIWVTELKRGERSRWEPQEMFDSLKEARNGRWAAIPPAVQRISKYRRVEPKKRKLAASTKDGE